ncbi:MAG TPA: metallopeptidase family protein [Polyangia bacterium]
MRCFALSLAVLVVVSGGCSKRAARHPAVEKQLTSRAGKGSREVAKNVARTALREKEPVPAAERIRPARRCFPGDTPLSPVRPTAAVLDRAGERFDAGDYESALDCADEALHEASDSVEAHHGRAVALAQLGRLKDARDSITRALALDPDDPETLAAAADMYVNRLGPSTQYTEIGLVYAERAARQLKRREEPALLARVALLEGQALNDLGRSKEAVPRIDLALQIRPHDIEARYERAVADFELCQFDRARQGFEWVLTKDRDHAYAHYYLALVLERTDPAAAAPHLARARQLRPRDFQTPVLPGAEEFRAIVGSIVAELPADARQALGRVPLQLEDLPSLSDLTADDPPLSPTILGLFRGAPEGGTCKPALSPDGGASVPDRAIVLYRLNLARAVGSRAELLAEVRKTLLHELGHMAGEDDTALRARGLE